MEIRIEDYALPRMKALLYQRKIRPTTTILITITMTKRTTITKKKTTTITPKTLYYQHKSREIIMTTAKNMRLTPIILSYMLEQMI